MIANNTLYIVEATTYRDEQWSVVGIFSDQDEAKSCERMVEHNPHAVARTREFWAADARVRSG